MLKEVPSISFPVMNYSTVVLRAWWVKLVIPLKIPRTSLFSYAHVRPDEDPFREGQCSWLCHTDPLWYLGTIRTHWGPPCPRKPLPHAHLPELWGILITLDTSTLSLCCSDAPNNAEKSMSELCLKCLSVSGANKMPVTVLNIMLHFLQLTACTKGWIPSKGNEVLSCIQRDQGISWVWNDHTDFGTLGSCRNVTLWDSLAPSTPQDHDHPECLNETGGYIHAFVS